MDNKKLTNLIFTKQKLIESLFVIKKKLKDIEVEIQNIDKQIEDVSRSKNEKL